MIALILFSAFAQHPKLEPAKQVPEETSKLGPVYTAFPELKPPPMTTDGKPADRGARSKELHELIFKDVFADLPADATLLQKVQYQQVHEGLLYLQKIKEVIDLGRWDSAYYKEYLSMASQVHRAAAELHTIPTRRIRCFEARVILLKEIEIFVTWRVETGNSPPQDLHSVRFQRLQAEADLLALKESLKSAK
ncbi:hypothetical protein [Gemmata sp.]|uniref:hypothetical protein n=1 Tax=Gemmata sp. TaxID=1914242 RepID=UPI003F725E95